MNRRTSLLIGIVLIALGLSVLGVTLVLPLLGIRIGDLFQLWRLWPLTVIGAGLGLTLPPLLVRGRRGLGGLFIPGVPVLATGGILLFTSVLDWWAAWAWLWPVEVLAVAAGLALAAAYMRVIWLLIPAIIVGANGLLFQFCAITGLWNVWAVMWAIEPLSVGLSLLLIGGAKRRPGLLTAGAILCGVGGVAVLGMSAIVSASWLAGWTWVIRVILAAALVVAGVLLTLWSLSRRSVEAKTR
ncbi:MAG: hypothetical protein JXA09_03765 [Anaerolineae bacterium]|nr:hypothetical protein [Anaerolineae bacterium]